MPAIHAPAATAVTVRTTWRVPPAKTARRIRMRSVNENSIPMVKRRRTTPISASASTVVVSCTIPRAWGPATIPARRKSTIPGTFRREVTKMIAMERANMMMTLSRMAVSMGAS